MSVIDLTKWPLLVVVGDPVTPEQAMEILIRTDRLDLSSNDGEFSSLCASYLYGTEAITEQRGSWSLSNAFKDKDGNIDWTKYDEAEAKVKEELQLLELGYLHNSRIVSCYVGGPHGWCDWDGTINTSSYNIGKWPSVGDVYEDWRNIAQAFPYLNLKCQLITQEGEIAVEYTIKDGGVTVHTPNLLLCPIKEPDWEAILPTIMRGNGSERGCTFEYFKEAINYVRAQNANR